MLSSKVLSVGYGQKILSVGYEHRLLQLRSLLVRESLQVDVLEAFDLGTALEIASGKDPVDVILLCHTVPHSDQALIIGTAREEHAKIAALSIFPGMCASDTPGVPVSSKPDHLLAVLRRALYVNRTSERWDPSAGSTVGAMAKQHSYLQTLP